MKTIHLLFLFAGLSVLLAGATGYLLLDRGARIPVSDRPLWGGEGWKTEEAPAYVASLRAMGLPEASIRPLVAEKVVAQYEQKRQELASRPQSQQALKQLASEQEALVSTLLSKKPANAWTVDSAALVTSRPPTSGGGYSAAHGNPASSVPVQPISSTPATGGNPLTADAAAKPILPAALAPDSPVIPITTDQQVAEWEKIQDNFVNAVGGKTPNPNDPASLKNWMTAQELSDAMFKQKFGTVAFLIQNAEAGRQSVGQ